MRYDGRNSKAGDAWIQIIPIGIELLDQPDVPGPIPAFQSLLAPDGIFGVVELFETNQLVDAIFLGKAFY